MYELYCQLWFGGEREPTVVRVMSNRYLHGSNAEWHHPQDEVSNVKGLGLQIVNKCRSSKSKIHLLNVNI